MSSSSPLEVPGSPNSSSKRSLSRDSVRSSAAVSSLSIGSSPAGSAKGDRTSQESGADDAPLPWFLRQTKTEIHSKFVDLEWQQRNRLVQAASSNATSSSQWARVAGETVSLRNRYLNVDPFVNNRIHLSVPEGHDDYINASPIMVRQSKSGAVKTYIATQGPKDTTHGHIWRMIWHECASPAVVIMLTQTHESGREKCFQYYPHSLEDPTLLVNEEDEFGDGLVFDLTLVSMTEDDHTRSTVRELELKHRETGESKTVWHVLFSAWPDFSVPEGADKLALLNLIPFSLEKNSAETNPRIVHCSAGVGRSGTFIALDHLLTELDEGTLDEVPDNKDPIEEAVETLRTQRMMMVQGESQFLLLYETLREKWIDRWRERMGLPPLKRFENSGSGSGDEGGAEAGTSTDSKRGGATTAEEREAKVARLATSELEAELRQNAAAAE